MPVVLLICMINGLASPLIPWVVGYAPLWLSGFLPSNISVVFYLASLLISTLTFMLSGVVAAIFERATARPAGDRMTYVVWSVVAALLSLPTLPNAATLIERVFLAPGG